MCVSDAVKKGFTFLGAILVGLAGLTMVVVACYALNSANLKDADAMINADTANGDGVPVDLTKIVKCVLAIGLFAIAAAIFGCIGIGDHHKMLLCSYVTFALLFACFFIGVGMSTFMVMEAVEPTITRQVGDMCNATNYEQLTKKMNCAVPGPVPVTSSRLLESKTTVVDKDPCGPQCEEKVALVEEMGGCEFLVHACTKKEYAFVAVGFCVLEGGARPPMYGSAPLSPVTLEGCQDTCNNDIECTGIVQQEQNNACFVITTPGNRPAVSGWVDPLKEATSLPTGPITGADGTTGANCYKKDISLLVSRLRTFGDLIFVGCTVFGTILMLSVCCTFSHMYMVNTKRKGRKGFPALCFSMFCPCLRSKGEKKNILKNDASDEDMEDYSGEDYDDSD